MPHILTLNMSTYIGRLKSFGSYHRKIWPHSGSLSPENMAKSGFYYLGSGDAVKCYYCNKELQYWEKDEIPFEEHKAHQQTCPFVEMFSEPPNAINPRQAVLLEIKKRELTLEKEMEHVYRTLTDK